MKLSLSLYRHTDKADKEGINMKRIIWIALVMSLFSTGAYAGGDSVEYFRRDAEMQETLPELETGETADGYIYGGSGRDWIHDAASSADGRMALTGYTTSYDGTLSDRTKQWRAGWVMMLDENMETTWNFCSRSGDADHMHAPVFHADGTLTAVHETEGVQMKIVRLSEEGKELSDCTVLHSGEKKETMFSVVGAVNAGYLFVRHEDFSGKGEYILFDWDGRRLREFPQIVTVDAAGEGHLIAEDETGFCLYAIDDNGALHRLAPVYTRSADGSVTRNYSDVISLPDGGAAACGSAWDDWNRGLSGQRGMISRWDAQGNLMFEMFVTVSALEELVHTPDGFAVTGWSKAEQSAPVEWMLLRLDGQGIVRGSYPLGQTRTPQEGGLLTLRPDGSAAAAMMTGDSGKEDVRIRVTGP